MKTTPLMFLALFCSITAFAQQPPAPIPVAAPISRTATQQPPPKDPTNYRITVKWKDAKAGTNSLQILTAEGSFNLETIQSSVRINDSDIPTTVSFNGSITPLATDKARLKVFLGRTVPYVTSTYSGAPGKTSSSYQQMRVGLDSTFTVTFGEPLVIQSDENGEVSILVKREEN